MTLLQQRDAARHQRRIDLCARTRDALRSALADVLPGRDVIVFGSLTRPGRFNDRSDIDLALPGEVSGTEQLQVTAELMDRLDRPVDVVALDRCRFKGKILREGERWTA